MRTLSQLEFVRYLCEIQVKLCGQSILSLCPFRVRQQVALSITAMTDFTPERAFFCQLNRCLSGANAVTKETKTRCVDRLETGALKKVNSLLELVGHCESSGRYRYGFPWLGRVPNRFQKQPCSSERNDHPETVNPLSGLLFSNRLNRRNNAS